MRFPTKFHVIKDPVYKTMQFTETENRWIKPFIDSEHFQRLRHVKQLGLTDWIFPGAVHSRFGHGLGCCYVACQIANQLGLREEDKHLVAVAGLLHDIGHGPFSHMFEELFCGHAITHEMWTSLFLRDYASDIFLDSYAKENPNFPLDKDKLKKIQALIMHKETGNFLLADIISSQLDADRLDYLLRDSHFCGVTYGNYDFHWLLYCLTVIKHNGGWHLGVTRKGVGVVEEYLMARRLMIRNVYHHGKKLAAEELLKNFLHMLAQELVEKKEWTLSVKQNSLIKFLKALNVFNCQFQEGTDVRILKKTFAREQYDLYRRLCDYDVYGLIRHFASCAYDNPVVQMARRLYLRKLPKVYYIVEEHINSAKQAVLEFRSNQKNQPWQLAIIDLPHQAYTGAENPILLQESSGQIKYVHDDSAMIDAMSRRRESACLICMDLALLERTEGKRLDKLLQKWG